MMRVPEIYFAGMLLLAPAISFGDEKTTPDDAFLQKAISCGVAEVKISEYAGKHATNDKVKELADHLAKDHARLNEKLLEHAKGLKVAVLVGLEKDKKAKFESMKKLEGKAFDREYVKQVIADHQEAIKSFEIQSRDGTHADLKAFATETLPHLRKHLKQAREVSDAIN